MSINALLVSCSFLRIPNKLNRKVFIQTKTQNLQFCCLSFCEICTLIGQRVCLSIYIQFIYLQVSCWQNLSSLRLWLYFMCTFLITAWAGRYQPECRQTLEGRFHSDTTATDRLHEATLWATKKSALNPFFILFSGIFIMTVGGVVALGSTSVQNNSL